MCETVSTHAVAERRDSSVSTALIYAIAELEDVDPMDLDFALGDYVACDALDRILESGDGDPVVRVSLSVRDYDVVAHSPGHVVVSQPCDDPGQCVT